MEDKLNLILEELHKINGRFDKLETRFDNLETSFDNLEHKVDRLENEFNNLRIELRGEFSQLKEVFVDVFTISSKELNTVKVRIFDIEEKVKSSIFLK